VKYRALLSALTLKAQNQNVHVFETLAFEAPKTSKFMEIISKAGLQEQKGLFLASENDKNLLKSAGNVHWARVMRVQDVNSYEIMRAKNLVFSKESLAALTGGSDK
jgi:large subunit ribosomal protein L4